MISNITNNSQQRIIILTMVFYRIALLSRVSAYAFFPSPSVPRSVTRCRYLVESGRKYYHDRHRTQFLSRMFASSGYNADDQIVEEAYDEEAGISISEDNNPENTGDRLVISSSEVDGSTTSTKATGSRTKAAIRKQLREELRQYRIDQSAPKKSPAYSVLTNAAIDGICSDLPTNDKELLNVKGIGPKKLEMYGDDILDIVAQYAEQGLSPDFKKEESPSKDVPRPARIEIESLNALQRQAAEVALSGSNLFLSGAAGTGKSHVLKYMIQCFQERETKFGVCAPTGVAALNVGGSTLHSFFGVGLADGSIGSLVKKVRKSNEATKRIQEVETLLIDEVSMLSDTLLETLDAVAREIKGSDKPFGGIQIICVGDFFQLPPVYKNARDLNGDRDSLRPFCFDSPVWYDLGLAENTIELTEVQRQEHGSKFQIFLNMVRVGAVPPNIIRDFNVKCVISDQHPLPSDSIIPTKLYTHNRNVDGENEARLAELKGELVTISATDDWRERMPTGTAATIKKNMKASIAQELPDDVNIKVGAQVMLTRNKDLERGLVNGSRGVVERFFTESNGDRIPVVRFDNGTVQRIGRVEAIRYNPDGGQGCLVRKQLPLRLAWALTIHKSQGSTLTRAILDISSTFEAGQAYVSLSRVKDIDGLWMEKPIRMSNILVSNRVQDYYYKDQ